jgi:hypothetical protein
VAALLKAHLPALLLTLVAVSQIAVSKSIGMTPWKGGGFGMFSTLDHGAHRGVDVLIEAADRSEAQEIPPSLEEIAARAITCPADWLLRRLAEGIAARERRYGRPVRRITLTVWQTEFNTLTLQANERPLRTFVYDVP